MNIICVGAAAFGPLGYLKEHYRILQKELPTENFITKNYYMDISSQIYGPPSIFVITDFIVHPNDLAPIKNAYTHDLVRTALENGHAAIHLPFAAPSTGVELYKFLKRAEVKQMDNFYEIGDTCSLSFDDCIRKIKRALEVAKSRLAQADPHAKPDMVPR